MSSLFAVCALALMTLAANQASAQSKSAEKPPLYTYVSEWSVPRAMWGDYLKNEAEDNDMLKKAVSDGTLISYGSYTVLNHQEGQPTHGTWFSAGSMANILKFLEGLRATPGATSAPLAAAKHWDYIMESRNYNSHAGTFTNAYLRVGNFRTKSGSDPDGKILKATLTPLLEKLLSDGAIHGYQIDEESIHSTDPGGFFIVVITNGAEGLDKFNEAVADGAKSSPAAWAGFESTIDATGHRDILARVSSMTHK